MRSLSNTALDLANEIDVLHGEALQMCMTTAPADFYFEYVHKFELWLLDFIRAVDGHHPSCMLLVEDDACTCRYLLYERPRWLIESYLHLRTKAVEYQRTTLKMNG